MDSLRWGQIALRVTGWVLAAMVVGAVGVHASSFPTEQRTGASASHVSDPTSQRPTVDSILTVGDRVIDADARLTEDVGDGTFRPGRAAVPDTGTVRSSAARPGAGTAVESGPSAGTSGDVQPDGDEALILSKPELNRQAQPVRSRVASPPAPSPTPVVDLGGLVVDETLTPRGRTFYSDFFGTWRSPPTTGFYTVRVQERPTPGRGTLVQVFVNDDVTFQTRLQPQTPVKEVALQAARRTYAYVLSGRGILQIY